MSDLIKRINAIRNLPIQEDVVKYIMICELIDREGSQFEEKTSKWIPVSERLPEKNGYYLVTDFESVEEAYFSFDRIWLSRYEDKMKGVTAWMPLPDPYKEANK